MRVSATLAAGALAMGASAQNYLGFNSGATLADRSAKFKADFKAEFETAANLKGAPGKFNSVRLYTNIQAYSEEDPIEAFDAAVETNTKILLGVWASGTDSIQKEINALKKAVQTHGDDLTKLLIGVSIGSEDLYRNSVTGVKNEAGVGNSPENIVNFMGDWRKAFKGTPLEKVPVGHTDTWDVWPNATNKAVIDAADWLGVHEYPYYENGKGNNIKNSGQLFDKAYSAAVAAVGDKPMWVTETGWPVTGPAWDEAEASVKNAKYFWNEVGCRKLFNKVPTFWYTLRDSNPDNKMKFAITKDLSTTPSFDLSCPTTFETPDPKDEDEDKDKDKETNTSSKSGPQPTKSVGSDESSMTSATTAAVPTGTSPADESSAAGASPTPTADNNENAGASFKAISIGTYGALALVGGLMALF